MTPAQRKSLYVRLLLRTTLGTVFLLLFFFALPPILSILAPFIIAYLIAVVLNPLVSMLHAKLRLPRKASALILVILVFLCLTALIIWCIYTVINEAVALARNFQNIWDSVSSTFILVNAQLRWLLDFLPSDTEEMLTNITNGIYQWLRTGSGEFVNSIVSGTASVTTKVGSVVFSVIIFLLAAYFTTAEYQTIGRLPRKYLGDGAHRNFIMLKDSFKTAIGGYLKAQLLLALLAFIVMLPALIIYGQRYAFLLAMFLAFIDFLPILGTSAVLVPWGLVVLASGNVFKGFYLLILAGGFFLVRKMIEPHVVGSQTGLHPLVALISIFVGMQVSGIWGAVYGPLVVMIAINVINSGIFENTAKDIREAYEDLAGILRRDG